MEDENIVVTTSEGVSENPQVSEDENHNEPEVEEQESSDELEDETESEEDESDSDDEDQDKDAPEKDNQKKTNGFKKRVDRFKRKLSEKDEEIEYWKKQAISKADQPQDQDREVESNQERGDRKPLVDDFDSQADYLEALVDWKDTQKEIKAKEQEAQKKNQEKIKNWQERIKDFSSKHSDFEEVVEGVEDITLPNDLSDYFISEELGPAVMYELSRNPDELERIVSLNKRSREREILKLEIRLEESSKKQVTKKTTKAPAPISRVKGGARIQKDPSKMSFQEYEAWREKNFN